MKIKIIVTLIFLSFSLYKLHAQTPGFFYAFELQDEMGYTIDSSIKNWEMIPVKNDSVDEMMLHIEICEDSKTWKFYEGGFGYKGMDKMNKLEIIRTGNLTQKMTIEFPPTSHGEARNYENLYLGIIEFKEGTYTVKLPPLDEWKNLKQIKLCPLSYMDYSFLDISGYQK